MKKVKVPPHGKKRPYFWYDVLIAVEIVIYLVLTTAIFVVQKKIAILSHKSNVSQSTSTTSMSKEVGGNSQQFYRQKEAAFQEEMAKNPNDPTPYERLAQVYYRQGKLAETIAQYQKMLEKKPNDPEIHLALAQLYMSDPNYTKQAIEHLKKVLSFQPQHPKRKSIELWLVQLQKQFEQQTSISSNIKAKENLLLRWKKILAQEPNHPKRKELELQSKHLEEEIEQLKAPENETK